MRLAAEHRRSPITEMHYGGMQLHLLRAFNISILVALRKNKVPVLSVETWVSALRNSDLISLLSNWLLDHLPLKHQHPTGNWNNFTRQRNVTLQGERWENVVVAIYTPTWRDSNVIPYPNETQIWVLSAFGAEVSIGTSQYQKLFFPSSALLLWQHRKEEICTFNCWTVAPLVDRLTNNQL